MPLIAKNSSGADFDPIPPGVHQAVCYAVIDVGTQPSMNMKFPAKRKVAITWEIPSERIEIRGEDLPRAITGFWTLTLASKGKLRPLLESWRGRPFTQDELDGFDLENLIGANCLLNIVHNTVAGKTYANIASVSPLAKGMAKLELENERMFFALPNEPKESDIPSDIPPWLKAKIMQCAEFNPATDRHEPSEAEQANLDPTRPDDNDDIPF
jgi:hypothetical protein